MCISLICQTTIAILEKGSDEKHFGAVHKKYNADFPPKSKLRKRKGRELVNRTTVVFHKQRPTLKHLTPCFGILKPIKYYHQSKLFSYQEVQLHSAVKQRI